MTFEDAPAARIALAEAAAAAAVPPAPPVAPSRPVRFTGEAGAFWRLLLRGALLLAVTLGIYRFWLATDVRRFLWSNTEIAGESLEYNGTAAELLIGFLIAIALLVPINLDLLRPDAEHGGGRRVRQHARLSAAVRARPVRDLSRAALSPHPHGASRRALPSDRLGDPLCVLRDVLVGADRAHARPRLSVHAGAASNATRCATPTTATSADGSMARAGGCSCAACSCGSWSWCRCWSAFSACSAASISRRSAKRWAATSARWRAS